MLFDWLATDHVVPHNPATAVRGPQHLVNTGETPVLAAVAPQAGQGRLHLCIGRTRAICWAPDKRVKSMTPPGPAGFTQDPRRAAPGP